MADKRRKSKKKEPANVPLLLLILALCIVVIVVIVAVSDRGSGGKEDTDPVSDVIGGGTNDDTDKKDETDGSDTDGDSSHTETEPDSDTEETFVTDTETETYTDAETDTDHGPGYTVDTEVETQKTVNGDVTIVYPVIDPNEDTLDSELLNSMIREYMDQKFKYDGGADTDGEYRYEITDTVTALATDEFASIIVKGMHYVSDSPAPNIFTYTINCDIKASAVISASDLVYDFDGIKKLFLDGKFKLVEGMDGLLDETNYEDMIMEYRAEYGIYPNVYFTEDSFGMVIDLVYTLGGYALFEIPYSYVSDYVYCPLK